MRPPGFSFVVLGMCLCLSGFAQISIRPDSAAAEGISAEPAIRENLTTPPVTVPLTVREAASPFLLLVGEAGLVAVSPWLGLGLVGMLHANAVPESAHGTLDWYAQTWFWIIAFTLSGMCLIKDWLGLWLPINLKKALDLSEAVIHQAGVWLAFVAFVPLVGLNYFKTSHGLEEMNPQVWLGVSALMGGFLLVALLSYGVNMLMVVCPFPIVDTLVKVVRGTLVLILALMCWQQPDWAGYCALGLMAAGGGLFMWAWRLMVYGCVFIWDQLGTRPQMWMPLDVKNLVFTGKHFGNLPLRTRGYLVLVEDNEVVFRYRTWLFGRERDIEIAPSKLYTARGLINPAVVEIEAGRVREVFNFPPRNKSHELKLTQIYGFFSMREINSRGAKGWLRLMLW